MGKLFENKGEGGEHGLSRLERAGPEVPVGYSGAFLCLHPLVGRLFFEDMDFIKIEGQFDLLMESCLCPWIDPGRKAVLS